MRSCLRFHHENDSIMKLFYRWSNGSMLSFVMLMVVFIFQQQVAVVAAMDDHTNNTTLEANDDDKHSFKVWTFYHLIDKEYVARNTILMQIKTKDGRFVTLPNSGAAAEDYTIEMITKPIIMDSNANDATATDSSLESYNSTIVTKDVKKHLYSHPFYQVKMVDHDDPDHAVVYTSVPSCSVLRANYRDEIIVTLNSYGTILSFHYVPLISSLASKASCHDLVKNGKDDEKDESMSLWKTTRVTYEIATAGMTIKTILSGNEYKPPVGLKRIPNSINPNAVLNRQQQQQHGTVPGATATTTIFPDDQQQQQSPPEEQGMMGFFRRYWYIIVPMMIFQLLSGSAAEPPPSSPPPHDPPTPGQTPSQQQQRQPQQQSLPQRSSPTKQQQQQSTPTGGSGGGDTGSRRRRGKRD